MKIINSRRHISMLFGIILTLQGCSMLYNADNPVIKTLKFPTENMAMTLNEIVRVAITVDPEKAKSTIAIVYDSTDDKIVMLSKVDREGIELRAMKLGSAIITATYGTVTTTLAVNVTGIE